MQLDTLNDESNYQKELAYGRSKAANILFTRELAKRLEAKGVEVGLCEHGRDKGPSTHLCVFIACIRKLQSSWISQH